MLSFPYTRADVVCQCYAVATACRDYPVSAAPALAESLTVSIVVHRLHRDELLRNLQTLGVAAQRQPATQVRLVLIDNSDASELGEALRALAQQSGWPGARVLSGHGNVGYGAGHGGLFQSTYAQPVSRIRWEITETLLNARLAYDRIEGTDGAGDPIEGLARRGSNDGQIVASFTKGHNMLFYLG